MISNVYESLQSFIINDKTTVVLVLLLLQTHVCRGHNLPGNAPWHVLYVAYEIFWVGKCNVLQGAKASFVQLPRTTLSACHNKTAM